MGILAAAKGVMDFLSGNSIVDKVMEYFPPDMTPAAQAELAIKIKNAEAARDLQTQQLVNEATAQFNQRTKEMEGTASDLKTIPYFGGVIIFLRGCQRPAWGFATLWFDWLWLFKAGGPVFTERQEMALIVINCLVLGFLFGERAVKNLMPLIMKVLDRK